MNVFEELEQIPVDLLLALTHAAKTKQSKRHFARQLGYGTSERSKARRKARAEFIARSKLKAETPIEHLHPRHLRPLSRSAKVGRPVPRHGSGP